MRLTAIKMQRTQMGLPAEPTDLEVEVIAQSWSEHCKHKIFLLPTLTM